VSASPEQAGAAHGSYTTAPARPSIQAESSLECGTCGAGGELEPVTSHSLADGAERTEWFCADAAACNDRRFPGLADLLTTGWPGVATAEAEAEAEP
jgi:hypothetical protein